jgi:hypothetical protein
MATKPCTPSAEYRMPLAIAKPQIYEGLSVPNVIGERFDRDRWINQTTCIWIRIHQNSRLVVISRPRLFEKSW